MSPKSEVLTSMVTIILTQALSNLTKGYQRTFKQQFDVLKRPLTRYKTNGIGMKAIERKPKVLLAQPTPRLLYMADANNGKPAPKDDRIKSFPARTEAA